MRKPFSLFPLMDELYNTDIDRNRVNSAIMEDKAFAQKEQLRMQADAERQFQAYEQRLHNWQDSGNKMNAQIDKLREQLTIAINALEFYDETPNTIHQNLYDADCGQRARYTLLEIKKLEGK